MGSLGTSVARSVESRGIVSAPSAASHLTSRVLPAATSANSIPVFSSVNSSVAHNSFFMANTVQPSQQRTIDMLRHNIPNIGSRSSSFMGRPYGSSATSGSGPVINLNSGFGDIAPPPLDLNEYPSLIQKSPETTQAQPQPNPNSMVGRQAYGNFPGSVWNFDLQPIHTSIGMVKQATSETSEFTMSNEDFPALPGSQIATSKNESFPLNEKKTNSNATADAASDLTSRLTDKTSSQKRGILTTPEGKVTNIPSNMVTDQYGMIGLLRFIRTAETDSNLLSLAQGSDLTTLGLNLNSPDNLYPNFGGPWAETPCRPQDIDYHVPQEYLTNQQISKLAPIKFERYGEDLLFYLFYSNAGDRLQILAASELYTRDWRYHKEERVWITRAPGMAPVEKAPNYERGTYFYFDAQNWRKVPKEFHLEYDKLEERPQLPSHSGISHTPTSNPM